MFQIGFYAHSIFAHLVIEVRRKDFTEMLIHHVATLLLVAISFTTRFLAIGTLIVILHDFSDIVFELAKQYIYQGKETRANVFFAMWVLSWIVLRLVYYPFYILPASVYESVRRLGPYPHHGFCCFMLITLQCLHIFWSVMIFRMVFRMLLGGDKVRDTREDDDKPTNKKQSGKKKKQ